MYNIAGYEEAHCLEDVYQLALTNPKIRLVAGGTDVLVRVRADATGYADTTLVGISRLPELRGISLQADGTIRIGALCSFTDVEQNPIILKYLPLLSQAVALVGGPQTRHVGTVGGNLCNASTGADSAPAFFTFNTICEIRSIAGTRYIPVSALYAGPGRNTLQPGEVLTSLRIARADYEGYCGHYTKFARRQALDIALLSCAAWLKTDAAGKIQDLRLCFGAAGPVPIRATTAETIALKQPINETTLKQIGSACLQDTHTVSGRISKAYRDHLVQILPGRNILTALQQKSDSVSENSPANPT